MDQDHGPVKCTMSPAEAEPVGEKRRCAWAGTGKDPLMLRYHDEEWGVPIHDDRALFLFLVLEGMQAGRSAAFSGASHFLSSGLVSIRFH
jgi:Methyladenine glycosylase